MMILILCVLISALQVKGLAASQANSADATLTIRVTDQFGYSVPGVKLSVEESVRDDRIAEKAVPWANGSRIKRGTYTVLAEASGFRVFRGEIKVKEGNNLIAIGLLFVPREPENKITIHLSEDLAKCSFARIIPLFVSLDPQAREIFLNSKGTVTLVDIVAGDYVLLVYDDELVCGTSTIRVTASRFQEVDIRMGVAKNDK
jgi:hypothetical protein